MAKAGKARNWRSRLSRTLLFVTVQVVIAFLLLELLARFLDPLGVSYYPETARFFDTMVHEEPIAYRLRPGLDADFHHAHYKVNSIGTRGDEVPVPKPENEYRVLWLGDSIVFGIGVEQADTIPAVVERMAARARGDRHFRMVNMGVPSYNTEQELTQFETLGMQLQPDAVVLFFASNDIDKKNWVFDKRASFAADFAQRSYALSTLFVLYRRVLQARAVDTGGSDMGNYAEGNPRWQAIADSLDKIHDLCKERGLPFVVYAMGDLDSVPNSMVAAEGRKHGFPVVGLQPALDPRWPDADSQKYRNSAVDFHCNPVGCSMWGSLIYEDLARRGIFTQ